MHTQGAESATEGETGLGAAAKQVAEHASALVRLELELAQLEVKRKVARLGIGIGLGLVAGLLLLFMLAFLLAAGAAALATTMSTWLALLIVAGGLVVLAGPLRLGGLSSIKKGTPAVPEQAIAEAKLTPNAPKGHGGS